MRNVIRAHMGMSIAALAVAGLLVGCAARHDHSATAARVEAAASKAEAAAMKAEGAAKAAADAAARAEAAAAKAESLFGKKLHK